MLAAAHAHAAVYCCRAEGKYLKNFISKVFQASRPERDRQAERLLIVRGRGVD